MAFLGSGLSVLAGIGLQILFALVPRPTVSSVFEHADANVTAREAGKLVVTIVTA